MRIKPRLHLRPQPPLRLPPFLTGQITSICLRPSTSDLNNYHTIINGRYFSFLNLAKHSTDFSDAVIAIFYLYIR